MERVKEPKEGQMPTIQFTGLATGIDTAALIDAIIEARSITNIIRENEVEQLEAANTAIGELETMVLSLNSMIDAFREINGGGLDKQATSSDEEVLTATASNAATNGAYDITVNSLAQTATGSFYDSTSTYTSTDDVFSTDTGSIDVTVGTGANQFTINVGVTGGSTTVADVVDAINNDANASGRVSATAVNVGTADNPDYRVVVNTLESGTDQGTLAFSSTGISNFTDTIEQADNANITIDGIGTIERTTNNISDVITGVTLNLSDTGGPETITVSNDASNTAESIQEIVDKFNEIVTYVKENNSVTRVEEGENVGNAFGTLAKVRVDDDFLSQFRLTLSGAESENGSAVTAMSELGISTNQDGTLSFDSAEFTEKLGSDPTGVAEVLQDFAEDAVSSEGTLTQFTRFNGLFDLAVDTNDSQIERINDQIERLNRANDKLRESLTAQYARLEEVTGSLNNQGQALTALLSGLGI